MPSWVSCLDESMSIWYNKWICPGWVFCPCKLHPFGNEYHTIAYGVSGIMYDLEIIEGKDHPREIPPDPSDQHGKTVGLLLRLSKSLYSTGKVIIVDSGFCVLQGIVELRKKGSLQGHSSKRDDTSPIMCQGTVLISTLETRQLERWIA